MSNIEEYTKNFKFIIPEFNVATWHTEIKENFKAIDALIANFVQSQQYQGAWKQVTSYTINDLVYISDEDSDYYGFLMRVKVNHTTTGDDFDTFLANNPTYYEVQGEMGAQVAALRAQDWAEKTDGKVIINNVPVDYSSKAYAIGGTGTETNNSKYFKEQAELARDTILNDSGFIAIKADFLGDETIKTVAENIQHVQNIDTNLQSVVDVSTNIADINTLASNIAAILTNSANISSINTNATNILNINNVSSNISNVNNCANNMPAILDAPNQASSAASSAALSAQYANDKINQTHITNCLTYVPQDIKFDFNANNHKLTIKAGSKVYVPDGNVYRIQTITADISIYLNFEGTFMLCIQEGVNSFDYVDISKTYSGSTNPQVQYSFWYDTTNNKIKLFTDNTSTPLRTESLPILIVTAASDGIKEIKQVFNGFGYIGSEVFALPGIKGLIPNGKNNDGTLKSIEFETQNLYRTSSTLGNTTAYLSFYIDEMTSRLRFYLLDKYLWNYDEQINLFVRYNGVIKSYLALGTCVIDASNRVTHFANPTVFHALDYNSGGFIAECAMPSNKFIDLTLGASGSTYTAPANGLFYIAWTGQNYDGYVSLSARYEVSLHEASNNYASNTIFVKRGDVMTVYYRNLTLRTFRFVYAEGEV